MPAQRRQATHSVRHRSSPILADEAAFKTRSQPLLAPVLAQSYGYVPPMQQFIDLTGDSPYVAQDGFSLDPRYLAQGGPLQVETYLNEEDLLASAPVSNGLLAPEIPAAVPAQHSMYLAPSPYMDEAQFLSTPAYVQNQLFMDSMLNMAEVPYGSLYPTFEPKVPIQIYTAPPMSNVLSQYSNIDSNDIANSDAYDSTAYYSSGSSIYSPSFPPSDTDLFSGTEQTPSPEMMTTAAFMTPNPYTSAPSGAFLDLTTMCQNTPGLRPSPVSAAFPAIANPRMLPSAPTSDEEDHCRSSPELHAKPFGGQQIRFMPNLEGPPVKVSRKSCTPAPRSSTPSCNRSPSRTPHISSRPSHVHPETIASYIQGPEEDGKYVCLYDNCMKRFGRKYNIQSHIQTHLSDRPYRCEICRAGFVRRHDLRRHARIHEGEKPYMCACSKGFARMDALTRHRQRGICVGAFTTEEDDIRKRRGRSATACPEGIKEEDYRSSLSPSPEPMP
ncbi:hypothetical protein SAICODRAFT_87101 [Saitoella complicata NRRL Y-17804]|nr:uncharacterized protein SAICODRAFT_87101 [Saitoella complicata NRRL Y-17804]ODQ56352.1 hypothetical protein SAICODRAFT_87101 [Saitoella complicata NRRL Y-17804]